MVKADLTRDYYADLGLQPGASDADIKKQFRQLALKYHPDRNPGHEAEVNSKFQTIQSAHEVLTDPEQKAKYDNARLRSNTTRAYSGFSATTTASGTRGNPWSSAGSEWAPPPKPPPPRDFERRKPPPTSAGAARYANFATPNGTTPKANQNAEARRKNYEAWESMRPPQARAWQTPKQVPKEYTPQSGREESNSKQYPPPPKSSRPGYEEFRTGASSSHSDRTSPSRSYSTRESVRKNGFMPGTPGPDEPPASNTSAYFSRNSRPSSRRQADAPSPPPREPPRTAPAMDPLRQFKQNAGTPFEPRLSTPYATHGGEKTNPFENINLNRPKSTRVPTDKTNSANAGSSWPSGGSERHRSASPPRTRHGRNMSPEPGIARADSEIHLGSSPKRTHSTANRTYQNTESSRAQARYAPPVEPISSDGDDSDSDKRRPSFGTRSRTFAKRRAAQTTTRPKENQVPPGGPESSTGENNERPRKTSLAEFRQWWSSSERKRNALNDILPDGTPSSNANPGNGTKDAPSMYAISEPLNIFSHSAAVRASTLPTVVEELSFLFSEKSFPRISHRFAASSEDFASIEEQRPNPVTQMTDDSSPDSPSGASVLTPPGVLTSFETTQRKVVEELLRIRPKLANPTCDAANKLCSDGLSSRNPWGKLPSVNQRLAEAESFYARPSPQSKEKPHIAGFPECLSSGEMGSPSYKIRRCNPPCPICSLNETEFKRFPTTKHFTRADKPFVSSFSFNVGDETFKSTRPPQTAFTSSAENISTTFTPEDWHGKFEAGDYFTNDTASMKGGSRTRSGSRTRTRSPVKGRPISRSQPGSARPQMPNIDPEILHPTTDSEQPSSSPGGTKFTAEEWARTFMPQNFAPPPFASSTTAGRTPLRTARRTRTGPSTAKPLNATKPAGTAAMVSEGDSSDSPLEMGKRTSQPTATPVTNNSVPSTGTDSPNAMDIDPPLDEQANTPRPARENGFAASNNAANEARNVPVEPSRPEWRAGDAGGSDVPIPPGTPKQPELPPKPGRRTTKSADEEDFKTNFEDLKNVEPLRHPATGLHSFNDLTSTLPFPSQAASTLTIPRNFSSGELDLPHPPRAPMVPPVIKAARPSMAQWDNYLLAFKTYMADWDIFNTKMIIHFVARKSQVDGMKPGWLEAFGDSDLEKYKEGLVEDFKVRQWWDVACEKHQDAIEKFQFFKGCMREGGPTQRGAEVAN